MKIKHESLSRNHPNREMLEELCCLSVLGELSREDKIFLEGHLSECEECRELVKEFERIVLFDLPAVAVLRTENFTPESMAFTDEDQIRARVLEKAKARRERSDDQGRTAQDIVCSRSVPFWRHVKHLAKTAPLTVGWVIAAVLLFRTLETTRPFPELDTKTATPITAHAYIPTEVRVLEGRAFIAERERDDAARKLKEADRRNRDNTVTLARLISQNDALNSTYVALKTELLQRDDLLKQRTAELELTRSNLNEQLISKDSLQGQLSEAYERLQKNGSEVARLERIAATTPPRLPVSEPTVDGNEAKDILGARELHIVDVYDVDNAGKSSRAYGRVYYVNRSLLVFYAFDLSKLERDHMAVAFQAWGFRQPQSTTAESLGLFSMDNATLNRWTLRVSDPQLLARIDTLFVTVEPPGGSRFPKGRRLLMASLAGPANHP
jgi:anti-sigma-K factor RskA